MKGYILALDPGETVGWATFSAETNYHSGQILRERLWGFLETAHWPYAPGQVVTGDQVLLVAKIVLEVPRSQRRVAPTDIVVYKSIGIVEEWARQHKVPIVEQGPDKMWFWHDDRLKEYSLYRKGLPHGNDAMRHLAYYLFNILKVGEWKKPEVESSYVAPSE